MATNRPKKWLVITPEYSVKIPILDFGEGPSEIQRDVVTVEATTKREALKRGYHELKKIYQGWMNWHRDTSKNPFIGLEVEAYDD